MRRRPRRRRRRHAGTPASLGHSTAFTQGEYIDVQPSSRCWAPALAVSRLRSPAPLARSRWKAKYPELVLAVVPAENASGVPTLSRRSSPISSKQLGTKVTLRVANDYAAVIEGQRAGNIHIALLRPGLLRPRRMTGVKTEPSPSTVNNDGTIGYYSVFYVRADSPYQKIEDLKGKNLGLVDPNSTSGNNMPRFALNKHGIEPESSSARSLVHRQPRERRDRAAAGHGRCRRQLVELRRRFQPDAHAVPRACSRTPMAAR